MIAPFGQVFPRVFGESDPTFLAAKAVGMPVVLGSGGRVFDPNVHTGKVIIVSTDVAGLIWTRLLCMFC
jgi:hypothetical protein